MHRLLLVSSLRVPCLICCACATGGKYAAPVELVKDEEEDVKSDCAIS